MVSLPFVPNVAVVDLRGRIAPGSAASTVHRAVDAARRLPTVSGVLLRVDSPGGDAYVSEDLREAVGKLAAAKPVVAHIGRVCASGGYLVATAAHEIVAAKWSLVGSIGVVVLRPNVTNLLERIGVDVIVRKTGRFKDLGSPFRAPTDEDAEKESELIQSVFADFVDTVAASRSLSTEAVQRVATGEVFDAARAVDAGLIDAVGTFADARSRVAALMGTSARPFPMTIPGERVRRLVRPAASFAGAALFSPGRVRLEWLG